MQHELMTLPLAKLHESEHNPRKTFDDLKDLAESIRQNGVKLPITVRPRSGGTYEVVCGHRRVRASKLAEKKDIPALVVELDDKAALELQIIENSQREGVHPIEEADAYKRLLELGYTRKSLADKLGRSVQYVAARLQYLELCERGQAEFRKGTITATVALMLARIPGQERQEKALDELVDHRWQDGPVTVEEARNVIEERFMLRMSTAPFDTKDPVLVLDAGPCTTCVKRSINDPQKALFPDVVGKDDLCSDPDCFAAKKLAALEELRAKAKGKEVLKPKEAAKALTDDGRGAGGFVTLKERVNPWGTDTTTWKDVLGKDAPTKLALGKGGKAVEVLKKSEALELLKKEDPKLAKKLAPGDSHDWKAQQLKYEEQRKRDEEKRAVAEAAGAKALPLFQAAIAAGAVDDTGLWQLVCRLLMARHGFDLARKRGIPESKLAAAIPKLNLFDAVSMAVELLLVDAPRLLPFNPEVAADWAFACRLFGVDAKKLEEEAKAELEAAKKPEPATGSGAKGRNVKKRAKADAESEDADAA